MLIVVFKTLMLVLLGLKLLAVVWILYELQLLKHGLRYHRKGQPNTCPKPSHGGWGA